MHQYSFFRRFLTSRVFQPFGNMQLYRLRMSYSSSSGIEGSVKSAGGSFAKKEAAQEDQYIRKLNAEKLEHLQEVLEKQYHKRDKNQDKKKKSFD